LAIRVSFTVENGVTPKTDRYEREQLVVGDKSSKKYKVTVLNDIVYNPANLKFGAISRNKYGNAVFSPIYVTFSVNNDVTMPEFIEMLITRKDFIKRALKYQQGTVYERQSVSPENLLSMNLYLPGKLEQEKIGTFFKHLDDTISLQQRKLDLLKEQKKGYLQKMFPKNGEKIPELRFAGFADDWEERKLSSGLREYTDRVIVEDDKEYYQISVRNNFGGITLRGSKMGNKIGRKRQAKINLTKYPQTLIFTRQTVEQGGIGWVDKYCDGAIVTENMPTISLDTSVFSKYFLTNLFQTRIFYKNAILDNIEGGSAQIAIHESKFLSSTLLFPNLDEQQKIGQFFKQLDDTID
ncbi:restriction endonuclease subunit S, partial [Lactococcus cremoris]|uniref:restriction endonuclease subunit S n=1 Tax=Lactococcus lactis subsp. cremoris TaxID=1359 RepID=UPI0024A6618C